MTIKYLDSKRISASTSDYPLGTNNGTEHATWDKIIYTGSVEFDGSNDNIQFGDNTDWNFMHNGGSWTASFWMKPDNTSDRMVFNTNGTTNTNIGVQSILTGGNLRTRIGNGSGDWVTVTKSSFSTGTWYFVVITFDGTTLSVQTSTYGGSLSSFTTATTSGSPSSANSLSPMTLGSASDSNTTYPFDGHIHVFMIWDRVLTFGEINAMYSGGTGSTSYSTSGLSLRTCFQITGESFQWFDNQVVKPTNVENNSILVEKNTGSRYWFNTGDYTVHTFTTTGNQNFVVTGSGSADILVVAGGGSGGYYGAGGGAGGVLYGTNINLSASTYVVKIGAGGTPDTSHGRGEADRTSINGGESKFGSLTSAIGGGEGGHGATGTVSDSIGANGGSGGGGSHADNGGTSTQSSGSSLTSNFGTSGGNGRTGFSSSNEVSAGGGGAGAVGVQGDTSGNGGVGGAGTSSSISGSAVTYAGGGGGGTNTDHFSGSQVGGVGGSSIGGNGASASVSGVAGTPNTGSGGGGGNLGGSANNYGGAGGSGIIIVRYRKDSGITATGGDSVATSPPDTWTMNPTFEDDFSSDNWTDADSTNIGVAGGVLHIIPQRDGSNDASYIDLTTVSDTAWVMRFKADITTYSQGSSGSSLVVWLALSDSTGASSVSQDSIQLGWEVWGGGNTIGVISNAGAVMDFASSGTSIASNAVRTDYFEIIRNSSTLVTVNQYSDSAYSTLVNSITRAVTATTGGLRYLKCINDSASTSEDHNLVIDIDDISFYNGVTTIN